MYHCQDAEFNEYVKKQLLFHKVVSVKAFNDQNAELVLDNGTILEVRGNEGCGGCENGWYYLTTINKCDNAITNVEVVENILNEIHTNTTNGLNYITTGLFAQTTKSIIDGGDFYVNDSNFNSKYPFMSLINLS